MSLALFAPIVFVAFAVEAAIGFGATVIIVSIGAQFSAIAEILPVVVPLNLVLSLAIAARHAERIAWRLLLRRVLPLMALGFPFGLLLLNAREARLLPIVFSAFVVTLATAEIVQLLRRAERAAAHPFARWTGPALLVVGGVAHGALGSGGPLVVAVANREMTDKSSFRTTLAALWFVLNAALLANFILTDALTGPSVERSFILAAPLIAAIVLGEWLHGRIPARVFRLTVATLLLLCGLLLFVRTLA